MMFSKRLRDGVRSGAITCSIRVWRSARVKVGHRYGMEHGWVVVDAIREIDLPEVTDALARRSGFDGVDDLMAMARHGSGETVYLVDFHYVEADPGL